MSRKLAWKRLKASDLTLFKWHYENQPAGTQKAFNLDKKVLVNAFFPRLGEPSSIPSPRYPVDLYLSGPGGVAAVNLQRKILKQKKNWRLNGEVIDGPEDDPKRFDILAAGDFALVEFSGDIVPSTAKVILISRGASADAALHAELERRFPKGSMWLTTEAEISLVLDAAQPPAGHAVYEWTETDDLEDAVLGGAAGTAVINRARGGRGVSPEDFIRSRLAAEATGVAGEQFTNDYLESEQVAGRVEAFEWTSSINAVAPYDFSVTYRGGQNHFVDSKATSGRFENPIHLSLSELQIAVSGGRPYDIYRLYDVKGDSAKLRIARNVGPKLAASLGHCRSLPAGVTVDGISIRPDFLAFEAEELILVSADDDS